MFLAFWAMQILYSLFNSAVTENMYVNDYGFVPVKFNFQKQGSRLDLAYGYTLLTPVLKYHL